MLLRHRLSATGSFSVVNEAQTVSIVGTAAYDTLDKDFIVPYRRNLFAAPLPNPSGRCLRFFGNATSDRLPLEFTADDPSARVFRSGPKPTMETDLSAR